MIGQTFGRWEVIDFAEPYVNKTTGYKSTKWKCKCSCGNIKDVRESSLLGGDSASCGCLARENASIRHTTHGLSGHKLYRVWFDMLRRCNDSERKDYKHYGGRGISVCKEWSDSLTGFGNFLQDMKDTHVDGLELDRIDVNGNYCKENCRWVDRRQQVINRRQTGKMFDTHFVEFNGEKLCISQWADRAGINKYVISDRLTKLKWSVEKALTTPVKVREYFINVDSNKLRPQEVFAHPPNLYHYAKKNSLSVPELLANIFFGKYKVTGTVNKVEIEFKPTKDLSYMLETINLKDNFVNLLKEDKADVEEFFDKYGVTL